MGKKGVVLGFHRVSIGKEGGGGSHIEGVGMRAHFSVETTDGIESKQDTEAKNAGGGPGDKRQHKNSGRNLIGRPKGI